MRCKRGHEVPFEGRLPAELCPTCGARVRMAHPFVLGVALGFGASILVSVLELLGSSYTFYSADSSVAWAALLAAIPSVFILTGGFGAAFLKAQYGNTLGVGRIVLGSVPVVIVFTMLWAVLLLFIALIASCGAGTC